MNNSTFIPKTPFYSVNILQDSKWISNLYPRKYKVLRDPFQPYNLGTKATNLIDIVDVNLKGSVNQ